MLCKKVKFIKFMDDFMSFEQLIVSLKKTRMKSILQDMYLRKTSKEKTANTIELISLRQTANKIR